MPETIQSRLRQIAESRPGSLFCTAVSGGRTEQITFWELYSRSLAYAGRYRELGVKSGDVVILILRHAPHAFYGFFGALLAGAIPSFMPFPSPKQRPGLYWSDHAELFCRIRPSLVVTYPENFAVARHLLDSLGVTALIANDSIESGAPADPYKAHSDEVACMQHSSGTTGLKKGVLLTHRAILSEVDAYAAAMRFGKRDSIASWLPLYHDMGFIACFMSSALLGTHLVQLDPFEWTMRPTSLLDAIATYRTTFTWLPNFAFSHIVNGARDGKSWDLSSMRAFVNCSEPCKASTFRRFADRFKSSHVTPQKLQVCYAMAENVFAVTQTELDASVRTETLENGFEVLSCGRPVDGVEVKIASGEICIRGQFLFDGYYKLPEESAEKLRGGWYHSGDLGFLKDGELYVTGRIDDMLIVAGRNYFAHEIEAAANAVPGVLPGRNVAIGIDDARTDATVVVLLAECQPNADGITVGHEIKREVLERVGLALHSVVPLHRGELIKTTSGKINRTKNKALYLDGTLIRAGGKRG